MEKILIGFLIGALTGGAGGYIGAKYTDRRREQEHSRKIEQQFKEVVALMPELIGHLKSLLSQSGTSLVREIVVLANRRVVFTPSKKCFLLMADRYTDLAGKISILENSGYIVVVTRENAEIYRLTEEFVKLILAVEI